MTSSVRERVRRLPGRDATRAGRLPGHIRSARTVLFHRNFLNFHGGHLKVWNYFNHVLASSEFTPRITFTRRSTWDLTNPWRGVRDYVVDSPFSAQPDVFFVGVWRDWAAVDAHPRARPEIPVINLVQSLRHMEPESSRFDFLKRRAIRICVSEEVSKAVQETGIANGPVMVIPNGLDLDPPIAGDGTPSELDVLVVAIKRPSLGAEVAARLMRPDRRLGVLSRRLPRREFLSRVRGARTTLFLPHQTEGFYLPALEGMALGTLVVCPDCIGNRSFCLPGRNAFRPDYATDELVRATEEALALPSEQANRMRANARRTAEAHSLLREREAFFDVLRRVDELW